MPSNHNQLASASAAIDSIADKLRVIILKDILAGVSINTTQAMVSELINSECEKLSFVDAKMKQSLGSLAQRLYASLKRNLNSLYSQYERNLTKAIKSIKIGVDGTIEIGDDKLRNEVNSIRGAFPVIKDYYARVQEQLYLFRIEPPVVSKGSKKMSLRALSEMKVRYEETLKDIESLSEAGVQYAWISSHANCSERCAPYQGRLVSLKGNKRGYKNGIPFIPLSEVQAGPKKDGNGCITGYNCRHYLIPFVTGSREPTKYSDEEMKKEREIDQKLRYYENAIRNLKQKKSVEMNADTRKSLGKRIERYTDKYTRFCIDNKRTIDRQRVISPSETAIELEKLVDKIDPVRNGLDFIVRSLMDKSIAEAIIKSKVDKMIREIRKEFKKKLT